MKNLLLLILTATTLFNCSENPKNYIKHIDGYWEIKHVEKNNQLLKEYNVNMNIDYFEVDEEKLTGFRKKVTLTLEGKYVVNKHEIPFMLIIEDNELIIRYTANDIEYEESIVTATDEKLVIKNQEGIVYVYRPFKQININYE